jgi:hypothetical protein
VLRERFGTGGIVSRASGARASARAERDTDLGLPEIGS